MKFTNTIAEVRESVATDSSVKGTHNGRVAYVVIMPLSARRACYAINFLPIGTPAGHTYKMTDEQTTATVVAAL